MRIETYLQQSPVYEISRAFRRVDQHLTRLLLPTGLHFVEALMISSVLFEEPGTVTPSQLAETFTMTRSNISHCISSLEAKGLISRQVDAEDTRVCHLRLKPAGRKCAMQVVSILDRLQRTFERKIMAAELQGAIRTIRAVEEVCAAGRSS
jgi:DNA-binding MarR family transcriptional regulator